MTTVKTGDRVRVTETYPKGTTVTYEGIVREAHDDMITFQDDGVVGWQEFAVWPRTNGIKVTVEVEQPPLPTTPGSVIRARFGGDEPIMTYMLTSGDYWLDDMGSTVYQSETEALLDVEIVFIADDKEN